MRRLRCLILTLAILAGAGHSALPQATSPDTAPPDLRLAATVSLEMPETTLADLLKDVSEKTGINHQPDSAKPAWHVQQRKLCAYAKDVPLSTLQTLLRKLLNYSWKTDTAASQPGYIIYQSDTDKAREEKERREIAAKEAAQWSSDWKSTATVCKVLLNMQPDQLKKITGWQDVDIAKAGYLVSLPEPMLNQLINGEHVQIRYQDLQPKLRRAIVNLAWEVDHLTEDCLEGTTIHMRFAKPQTNRPFTAIAWEVSLFSRKNNVTDIANLLCHLTPIPPEVTESLAQQNLIPGNGWEFPTEAKAITKVVPQIYSESNPPDDPRLLAPVGKKLEKTPVVVPDIFEQISKSTGLPILCDYYDGSPFYMCDVPQIDITQPLYKTLNKVAQTIRRIWYYQDGAILFRDPLWSVKRTWDVPKEWKDYLKARLEEGLTFEDLVMVSGFSDGQLDNTLNFDKDLSAVVPGEREMLRFYRGLTESQKKRIWGTRGLASSSLSIGQRDLLKKLLENNTTDLNAGQSGVLQMVKEIRVRDSNPKDSRVYISLKFNAQDGTSATYSVMLPPATGKKKPPEPTAK